MSTNKSQNLNLHLWEPQDDFLRTEFNENFAAIDTAVKTEEIARNAAVSTALSAASRAQAVAEKLPYVMGSYTGTGDTNQDVYVGFKPSFLLIFQALVHTSPEYSALCLAAASPTLETTRIFITDTGFRIEPKRTENLAPWVNVKGTHYEYIAFR